MKPKFKKYLSISAAFMLTIWGGVHILYANGTNTNDTTPQSKEAKIPKFKPLPEIRIKTDTIYVTKEYLSTHKSIGLGYFNFVTNSITMKYLIPADDSPGIKNMARIYNSERTSLLRHELEHARKALLWTNTEEYAPFVRGEIACMNEVMAPASEVIESVENEWMTKNPTVGRKALTDATRAILAENDKLPTRFFEVDFTNQRIADTILKYAIDRYIDMFNRGAYKGPVRQRLDADRKWQKYKPNKECNVIDKMMFRPETGDWSQMFTFKTKNGKKVNIWKSASQKMRDEVQQRVDSATFSLLKPGEMLTAFKKPEKS